MTRSQLIARIASRHPQLLAVDAEVAVKIILEAISKSLIDGQGGEFRGFGSFSLNYRPPRVARNPKSGAKVTVSGKYSPYFKAGKGLREQVQIRGLLIIPGDE